MERPKRPNILDYKIDNQKDEIAYVMLENKYMDDMETYCNELEKTIEKACEKLEHYTYKISKEEWKEKLNNE